MNFIVKQEPEIFPGDVIKFVASSTIGVLFFLIPFKIGGQSMLLVNVLINYTKQIIGNGMVPIIICVLSLSAVLSLVGLIKPDLFKGYWNMLFVAKPFMVIVRVLAAIISIMVYLQAGPEFIWSKDTGGMMVNDLLTSLLPFFFWAGICVPLLTDYGFMEFVGTLVSHIMRPLFKIPGRSAINVAVAWIGSATMGAVIANKEFIKGNYTGREAVIVATGFGLHSVPMAYLFCTFLGISDLFPLVYLALIIVSIPTNIIMSRIPPISRKANDYFQGTPSTDAEEEVPLNTSLAKWAFIRGVRKAKEKKKDNVIVSGFKVTGDIWFTLEPIVLVLGTAATIVSTYTPFFVWLSYPFIYILQALGLPDAVEAAPTMLIGFVDVFLPFILGAAVKATITKFVIAVVALVQVIFIDEIGAFILKSKIPANFLDLVIIFLERTIISLPLVALFAYICFTL